MSAALVECFVNPVKCRILLEIHAKGRATAKHLAEVLPNIPQATLYRSLGKMLSDEIIYVYEEHKVRALVEKVYAIRTDLGNETQKLLEQNSGETYFRLFTEYMMGFMREFQEYAGRPSIDILNDGSGFSVGPVYATKNELEDALMAITKILEPLRTEKPNDERKLHSIGIIITPPKA